MVLNLPDEIFSTITNLTRTSCIAEPREAWGRPIKCLGWEGGKEME